MKDYDYEKYHILNISITKQNQYRYINRLMYINFTVSTSIGNLKLFSKLKRRITDLLQLNKILFHDISSVIDIPSLIKHVFDVCIILRHYQNEQDLIEIN